MARKTAAEKKAEALQKAIDAQEALEHIAEQIGPYILQGHSFDHIRQFIANQAPDTDPEKAIALALDNQTSDADRLAGHSQQLCVNLYRELIQQMRKVGDFPSALRAAEKLEKLTRYPVSNAEDQQKINLARILNR